MKMLRRRLLAPFRTLGWKLTLSYTLVTVAALLVVELVLVIVGLGIVQDPSLVARLVAQAMLSGAAQAAPFLDEAPPDINGLQSWLVSVAMNGFEINNSSGQRAQFTPASVGGTDMVIFVLDAQKKILAIVPEGSNLPDWPNMNNTIDIALIGTTDPEKLFTIDKDRKVFVVTPIQTSDGQVLGALGYTSTIISTSESAFSQILPLLASSALVFTIAAGAVGAIFGLITSHGLVRRLKAVSKAADAWSRGDFTIIIPERSSDELGQLALRLNEMSEQLRMLMQTRQELASLEERNRLARDLHDSVKQQVFATAMQVGAAHELLNTQPQEAKNHLGEAERLARLAQQELTVLIRELRPAALEGRGLAAALHDYLANWSQQCNIQFDLRVQGERALPLTVEQALYRVAQEALSNIARHSGASHADIYLGWQEGQLNLTLSDNGAGFNAEASTNKGVGLQSMRERVDALGGMLVIESSSSGTKIEITCPL